ncbi:hypothetical protein EDD37DRAFT_608003 [Exophiala viscosa]|uniref:uncharacterized protein n=1 Tax=Exophiala viscosa TaxID=2486360 RepID=UPI0021A10FCD|nr:hypothetical protein EDD37DRAFT_608003 [Exophiala viscosa]
MARTETIVEPTTVRETLRVYDTHFTGDDDTAEDPTIQIQGHTEEHIALPDSSWPSDWRRMPPYRPSSRSHRLSERPAGFNPVESTMVVVMFTGVWTYGVSKNSLTRPVRAPWGRQDMMLIFWLLQNLNRLWRSTVGRWNNDSMKYKIGGEW